jgi:hypothetical protein
MWWREALRPVHRSMSKRPIFCWLAEFRGSNDFVTAIVNILVSQKKTSRGDVAEIENQPVSDKRLGTLKIHFAEASPNVG